MTGTSASGGSGGAVTGCRQVEPLLAALVDDDLVPDQQALVAAHLNDCEPCRQRVDCERAAREVLHARRRAFAACAPAGLRTRCAACACGSVPGTFGRVVTSLLAPRGIARLALAATLLLAVSAVFFVGMGGAAESLAAQFAMDHVKCFQLTTAHGPVDALAAGQAWNRRYGWPLTVPRSEPVEELELVEVRRCLSLEGFTAHIMYKWHGAPLSLYVLNSVPAADVQVERLISRIGQKAVVWSESGRTYVVVGRGQPQEVQRVAHYVRAAAR